MLRLHHFFFGNGRLLFVLWLFRRLLRRGLRRLLRETETCTKEKRYGEIQKTMRTLQGRQFSLLYLQETKIGDVRHRMRERRHRQSVRSADRGARFLLQGLKSRLECGPRKKLISQERRMRRAGLSAAIPLLLATGLTFMPARNAAQQKKEDLPHPKTVEELQKAMKDVL